MPAFDFLNTIRNNLVGFFNQSAREGRTFLEDLFPSETMVFTNPNPPSPAPIINVPPPSPTPAPQQFERDPRQLERTISAGLANTGFADAPVGGLVPQFAQVGSQLPANVDPLLPIILALMESSGGQNLSSPNNLFNIGPGIPYPSLEVALLGGGPQNQLGFQGLLRPEGLYQDFLSTGDLGLFFNQFTPSSDPLNPSQAELISRFNALRAGF